MRSTWKRAFATLLTIAMLASLLVVPASATLATGNASQGIYVLDCKDLPSTLASGKDAVTKAGTDDYFGVNGGSAKSEKHPVFGTTNNDYYIAEPSAKENVWNTGGATQITGSKPDKYVQRYIKIVTENNDATVKLWWYHTSSTDTRSAAIYGAFGSDDSGQTLGTAVWTSDQGANGNTGYYDETSLSNKGTFYIGAASGSNINFVRVEVVDKSSTPSVTVTPATAEVEVSKTTTLTATVANADGATVTWTSDTEGVATVDQSGVVTGVAEGSATITATITVDDTDYTGTATVTVKAAGSVVYVTDVTIAGDAAISLTEGGETTLSATVAGTDGATPAATGVTWTSSNNSVASVDADGKVTAVGAGTATITATSVGDKADGSKATATVTVTVTGKPKVWVAYDELKTAMGNLSAYTVSSGNPSSCSWVSAGTDSYGGSDSATYAVKGAVKNKPGVIKLNGTGRSATFTPDMDGTLTLVLAGTQYAESIPVSNAAGSPFAGQEGCQEITFPVTSGTEYKIEVQANIFIHAAVLRPTGTPACTHTSYGEAKDLAAATCGDNKTTIKWCTDPICFHSVVEEVAGTATGEHTYEWKTVTEPTDDADGLRAYQCKVCGAAGTAPAGEDTVLPKLSHAATVTATNGTVTLSGTDVTDNSDGSYKIKNGATVTVTATAAEGYELGTITMDGTALTGTTFTMPAKDVAVVATFTKKAPVITVSADSVHLSEDSASADHTKTVTVTVANGEVADVTVNSADTTKATAAISNGVITITGVAAGETTVTVALTGAESKTIAVEVVAAGAHVHSYGEWVITAANCVEAGSKTKTCANADGQCTQDTVTEPIAIDATNHKGPLEPKADTAVAATCAATGKEADTYCTACNTKTADGDVIPKSTTHTFEADKPKCTVCNEAANPDYVDPTTTGDYTFDARKDLKEADITGSIAWGTDKAVIKADTTYGDFFTLKGDGTMARSWSTDHYGSIETAKTMKSYMTFTIPEGKTATLVVTASSNGTADANVSDVRLAKGEVNGTAVAEKNGTTTVVKNEMVTLTYENLAAGDYFFGSPADGSNTGRGVRIQTMTVTLDGGSSGPVTPPVEKKTVTFTIGDGASVTDVKVDGEAATLSADKKLVDIAKSAVVTFVAAVTDPAKTLSVTGATFADGVYTVTADTVTVTALAADEYTITCDTAVNGTVTADKTSAKAGETVTVTATPATGYKLEAIKVNGTAITGKTFPMPAENVTVTATFVADGSGSEPDPGPGPVVTDADYVLDISEEVAAGRLEKVTYGKSDPAEKVSNLGTEGRFTLITKFSGNSAIQDKRNSEVSFEDGYAGQWNFKTGGGASVMNKLESEGKCITFTTEKKSTVKVWLYSASGDGGALNLANQQGDAEPVEFYTGVPANQNVAQLVTITDVPAGINYLYSGASACFLRVEVTLDKDGDQPGTDTVDTKALSDAIAAAEKLAADTYTVSNDTTASQVDSGKKFVKQSAKDALETAIAAAKEALAAAKTQADVTKAAQALADAVATFNAAIQTGTKGGSGSNPTTPPASTRPNAAGVANAPAAATTTTVNNSAGGTTTIKRDANGNVTITATDDKGEVLAEVKLPGTIPALDTKFKDVPEGHWAEKSINAMAALGLVKGVADETFDMVSPITRGSVATILGRLANGKADVKDIFSDVAEGQWYAEGVAWAAKAGVVNGFEDGTFQPDSSITREQLAVMLARYAKLLGLDTTAANSELAVFDDADSVQSWALEGMAWCVKVGILNGRGDGTVDPGTTATRAEAAAMLARLVDLLK